MAQEIQFERRQHPREGILGKLENITYSTLRRYAAHDEMKAELENSPEFVSQKAAA